MTWPVPQEEANAIWLQQRKFQVLPTQPTHPQFGNGANPVIPDYINTLQAAIGNGELLITDPVDI